MQRELLVYLVTYNLVLLSIYQFTLISAMRGSRKIRRNWEQKNVSGWGGGGIQKIRKGRMAGRPFKEYVEKFSFFIAREGKIDFFS